jgi:hypothetical protein
VVRRDVDGRSSTAFVNRSVNETARDRMERWRRCGPDATSACPSVQASSTQETARDGGDARRSAHNPEVAGSNPAPAIKKSRSEA